MEDKPDGKTAAHGHHQDPIPRQRLRKTVQKGHVFGAVNPALQFVDGHAEERGRNARCNPDKERYEPKLKLTWPFGPQNVPSSAQGKPGRDDLLFDESAGRDRHEARCPLRSSASNNAQVDLEQRGVRSEGPFDLGM